MKFQIPWSMTDWRSFEKRQICPVINSTHGNGHFEIYLSWASVVRSDCPSYLKINLMVISFYDWNVMFSSKNAQFLFKPLCYSVTPESTSLFFRIFSMLSHNNTFLPPFTQAAKYFHSSHTVFLAFVFLSSSKLTLHNLILHQTISSKAVSFPSHPIRTLLRSNVLYSRALRS